MVMLGQEPTVPVFPLPGNWKAPDWETFNNRLINKVPLAQPRLSPAPDAIHGKQVQDVVHPWSYYQTYKSGAAGIDAYEDRGFPTYNNNGQPSTTPKNWNTGNWTSYWELHGQSKRVPQHKTEGDGGSTIEGYRDRGEL